ncbi:hypothetical protein [Streptomyces sp. NBC_00358]|uniref:hypothetical protein n=1 Tax=Streptomyces sp. NBC_00358 TaxID=2975725 RepID=UPI002E27198E
MDSTHKALRHVPARAGAGTRTISGTAVGTGAAGPRSEASDRPGRPGRQGVCPGGHPPIYAQLVSEWRAEGRLVPEPQDVLWATFAAPGPEQDGHTDESVPAVPVPRGLPERTGEC